MLASFNKNEMGQVWYRTREPGVVKIESQGYHSARRVAGFENIPWDRVGHFAKAQVRPVTSFATIEAKNSKRKSIRFSSDPGKQVNIWAEHPDEQAT